MIGRRCKCSNVCSLPVLIGRGLDFEDWLREAEAEVEAECSQAETSMVETGLLVLLCVRL